MAKIIFENDSAIKDIPSKESNRSIRGRRMTDKESKRMQELEITMAEIITDKFIRRLGL